MFGGGHRREKNGFQCRTCLNKNPPGRPKDDTDKTKGEIEISSGVDDSSSAEDDEADDITTKPLLSEKEYKEVILRSFVTHNALEEEADYREQYEKMCSAVDFCKAKGQTVTDSHRCPICGWYAHALCTVRVVPSDDIDIPPPFSGICLDCVQGKGLDKCIYSAYNDENVLSADMKEISEFYDADVQYATFQEKTTRLNQEDSVTSLAYLSRLFKAMTSCVLLSNQSFTTVKLIS